MDNRNLKMNNHVVRICADHVVTDPDKIKEILERVSRIISNSYKRVQQEG